MDTLWRIDDDDALNGRFQANWPTAWGPKLPYDVLESGRLGLRRVRLIDGSQPLHRTFKQASLAILLLCFAGRARRAYSAYVQLDIAGTMSCAELCPAVGFLLSERPVRPS